MSENRCSCCKHWDHCYRNATCDSCRDNDKWAAQSRCKDKGVLRCATCVHSAKPRRAGDEQH